MAFYNVQKGGNRYAQKQGNSPCQPERRNGKNHDNAKSWNRAGKNGKKVLLVDADPQGDLTDALGWKNQDSLPITLATEMEKSIRDEPVDWKNGILHHKEGIDLIPGNIELAGVEVTLVNAMSREFTLKTCLKDAKPNYD